MIPKKVIFLVSHSSAGGVQEIWVNLAEGFKRRGHDVQLMALYPLHDRETRQPPEGLAWQWLEPGRPRVGIPLLFKLAQTFRRVAPNMIFAAMPLANVLAPAAVRIAGTRTRVVTSHHSPVFTHGRWINRLDSVTGSWDTVQAIVSVSESVKASLQNKPAPYRAKCTTIHNALPPRIEQLIRELSPPGKRQPSGRRKAIATGRLMAQKNHETLLAAIRLLPDVTIDIIGSGPDEAKLRAMAHDLGVTDRVHFLGQHPRDEVLAMLSRADLFVQPSLFEGHSLALIEAARLKLPLIVSTAASQIEGITDREGRRCGIAVETLDAAGLAQAINQVFSDADVFAKWSESAERLGAMISYDTMFEAYHAFLA